MNKALIIFARNPELGKVKTRLAAQIGNEKALEVYLKLLEHTTSIAINTNCEKYIFTTGSIEAGKWKLFHQEHQIAGDLGDRMLHAFEYLFTNGYEKVVIIGTDCPGLTSDHINDSFLYLDNFDVVIGPSKDGGYYLLGMKNFHQGIFENIRWSTRSVFEETLEIIIKLGLSFHPMETLTDVDEEKDLPEEWRNSFSIP